MNNFAGLPDKSFHFLLLMLKYLISPSRVDATDQGADYPGTTECITCFRDVDTWIAK